MIQLTNRSLVYFLLGSPLWLISPQIATCYLFFLGAFLLLDLFLLPKKSQLTVERLLPEHFVIDTPSQIGWKVTGKKGVLQDHFPGQNYCIKTDSEVVYQTYCPTERGNFSLDDLSLRLEGSLHLLNREYFFDCAKKIKVYPNCSSSRNGQLSAFGNPEVSQNRAVKVHQRGELESLRPYSQGEDLRNVEWKISAKKGEMICKNWEMENDRHISVLIDCGRRSAEIAGERSLLDHSLNATAQLCRLIQNKQDTFSLYAFSNKIEASLPKTDKKTLTQRTLETIYQLKPQSVESDYWQVIGQVMHKLTKRSLLILFSNVLDTTGSLGLINNLARASQKHLVLCVVMKDQKLEEAATADDFYQRGAACHLLLERERAIKHMRAKGIHVLDAHTSNYVSEVIQNYLRIREKI